MTNQTSSPKFTVIFYIFILTVTVFLTLCCGHYRSIAFSHQPDGELIRKFEEHQSEFNQLQQMLSEETYENQLDFESQVRGTSTKAPNRRISGERIQEYRRLMSILDIPTRVSIYGYKQGEQTFEFVLSQTERKLSNDNYPFLVVQKNYFWQKEPPRPNQMADYLDQYHSGVRGTKYHHLGGNWYLEIRDWIEDGGESCPY